MVQGTAAVPVRVLRRHGRYAALAIVLFMAGMVGPAGSTARALPPSGDIDLRSLIDGPTLEEGFLSGGFDQVSPQGVARLVPVDVNYRFRAPRASISETFSSMDARVVVEVLLLDLTTSAVATDSFGLLAQQYKPNLGARKQFTMQTGRPAFIVTNTRDDKTVRASANGSSGRFFVRVLVDVSRVSPTGKDQRDEADDLAQSLIERQATRVSDVEDGKIVGGTTKQIYGKLLGNLFGFTVFPILAIAFLAALRDLYFQRRVRRQLRTSATAVRDLPPPGQPIDVTPATRGRLKIMRLRRASAWVTRPFLVAAVLGIVVGAPASAVVVIVIFAGAEIFVRRSIRRAMRSDPAANRLDDRKYRRTTRRTAKGSMFLAYAVGAEFIVAYIVAIALATIGQTFAPAFGDSAIAKDLADSSGSTTPLAFACLAAGVIPYRWAARRSRRHLDHLLDHDPRQATLLLRSFVDDRLRIRAHRTGRHSMWERVGFRRWDYFEEIIASRMWAVGPVIAIGEPGAQAPPLGAARQYFADDNWQAAVAAYVQACSIITLVVGSTKGLRWELMQLRASGALDRTVFVIPPVTAGRQRLELLDEAYGWNLASWHNVDRHGVPLVVTVHSGMPVLFTARQPSDMAYEAAIDRALVSLLPAEAELPPPRLASSIPPAQTEPRRRFRKKLKVVGAIGAVLLIQALAIVEPGLALVTALVKASEIPVVTSGKPADIVAVGGPVLDVASDGTALFVSTLSPDDLLLYDSLTDRVGQRIPIATAASHVAMTAQYLAVTSSQATTLWLYDRATGDVNTVDLGHIPRGLAAVDEHFAVVLTESAELVMIDPSAHQILNRYPVGTAPIGVAPVSGGVAVADAGSKAVMIIDPNSGRETGRVNLDLAAPQQLAAAGDTIAVIAPSTGVVAIIRNGHAEIVELSPDASPYDVEVTPNGMVFVSDTETPTVWRIDGRTHEVTRLDAGPQPLRLTRVSDTVVVSMPPLAGVGILESR